MGANVNALVANSSELVSIPEFARLCGGISHWTVRGWLAKELIKGVKVGSRTMIRVSELARVIKEDTGKETCR